MQPSLYKSASLLILLICFLISGCLQTSEPPSRSNGTSSSTTSSTTNEMHQGNGETPTPEETTAEGTWTAYPDVPYVDVMEDVDGIPVARIEAQGESVDINAKIPTDVGNPNANPEEDKPVTGGRLVMRMGAEPKTLNPITESSAYQSIMGSYVHEALAWQNPETFEYMPHIAHKWVIEDLIKLAPNYPGKERQIALQGKEPSDTVEITYSKGEKAKPDALTFQTFDGAGNSVGKVWVGIYPIEKIPGAPIKGHHFWSNDKGELEVSGIHDGKYIVRVGAEIVGETKELEDGGLLVTPLAQSNPLSKELASTGSAEKPAGLTLKKEDYVDVHKEVVYTYYLRDDVSWSDGTPFTTKDMLFGYAVINNPTVDDDSLRVYYQDLVNCEAYGDYEIRMQYRQQYFKSFEFTLGLAAYSPPFHYFEKLLKKDGLELTLDRLTEEEEKAQQKVSAHGQKFGKFFNTDNRYNEAPLGTGPYIYDTWERSNRVVIRRNQDYWNQERAGYLDQIVFKFIPDDVTAFQVLKAGEMDFYYRMNPEQYFDDLKGPPDWFKKAYVKAEWFSPSFGYIGWNLNKPIFQDRRVRIALALLFDQQEFIDKKLHGAAVAVSGSQYIFGPAYDHQVKPIGYDPDAAQDLLAVAGWIDTDNDGVLDRDGHKFEFTIQMPQGSTLGKQQIQIIQKNLKSAGIIMQVKELEWASFLEKVMAKDFDAVRLGWASPLESDPFQIWHSSYAGADKRSSNHVSFSNAKADELIEMVRLTLDKEKRKKIYASFQRILDREQPYMFLYTSKDFGAYHERFRGVKWYRIRPGFDLTEWYVPRNLQKK